MERLDIHIHLGDIPNSKLGKTKYIVTSEHVSNYINKQQLTHAVIIYKNKEDYKKLQQLTPIKLFPIQWITNINNGVKIDSFAKGVKFHSHRNDDGCKLDYNSEQLDSILKTLPNNFIVYLHTQGSVSKKNTATPQTVSNLAKKYPDLKFIIAHSGSYGYRAYEPKDKTNKHFQNFYNLFKAQKKLVEEAVNFTNNLSNLWLDSSIIITHNYKAKILSKSKKFGFGSDFPFGTTYEGKRWNIIKQEKTMKNHFNYDIEGAHKRSIEFLERDL